jgi:threonine/homoserine/homoserine lactone efflux protein
MDAITFVVTVVLVTVSGALAPGPLFFADISHGARSGARSGLAFAVAHTVIEFALVILLTGGLLTVASEPAVRTIIGTVIGTVGGVVLIAFGMAQICETFYRKSAEAKATTAPTKNLILVGLALTGLNPYFIVWWLTAGANLILMSLEFASLLGVVFMYVCHVWMDYAWLVSVAHFAKIGANVAGFKWYKFLRILFGAILIYFGLSFVLGSL